jgi:hypothetical protein
MTTKHWTIREVEDEDVSHEGQLGRGGYGEVHKVCPSTFLTDFQDVQPQSQQGTETQNRLMRNFDPLYILDS